MIRKFEIISKACIITFILLTVTFSGLANEENIQNSIIDPVDSLPDEQGCMLVVTYDDFYNEMLPFVEWKNMKGIPTEIVNVSEFGDTNISIKESIINYYNNHDLAFVLLVGNSSQVPTFSIPINVMAHVDIAASDVNYSLLDGPEDMIPNFYIGRFPADNSIDVLNMVEKSINYEKYPKMYYQNPQQDLNKKAVVGIGTGVFNRNHIWDAIDELKETEIFYEIDNFTAPFINAHLFPDILESKINEGRGLVMYYGHSPWDLWRFQYFNNEGTDYLTADDFTIENVNNLNNVDMHPVIFSSSCFTTDFTNESHECLGGAFLKAFNNSDGKPTGAVAYVGHTSFELISTGTLLEITDNLIETSYELVNGAKKSIGGISFRASVSTGRRNDLITWNVFGDPSLQIRTSGALPQGYIRGEYDKVLPIGSTQFKIKVYNQTEVPIEGALCALSKDGNLLGCMYSDDNGEALLTFDPIMFESVESGPVGELDLVITAFNRETVLEKITVPSDPLCENGDMLVITHDDFYNAMKPLIQWKNQKGIRTSMVKLSKIPRAVGVDLNVSIHNYIKNIYNQLKDEGKILSYVLLVGDIEKVPSFINQFDIPPTGAIGACDQMYSYLIGDDNYPDVIVGRFPADNNDHIRTLVQRTIAYEKNPIGGDWYRTAAVAAGNHWNGWDHPAEMNDIFKKLLTYPRTYDGNDITRLYAGDTYSHPDDLRDILNEGVSLLSYFGHGSYDRWCFYMPPGGEDDFTINNINQLTNAYKLPIILQVACDTGDFVTDECFAEAWLHATDEDGDPTGAIAVCMPTVPVASGQVALQEAIDLITERSYHLKTTYGSIVLNAISYMLYHNNDIEAAKAYHIFGDPSLQIRNDIPREIFVDCQSLIPSGQQELTVRVTGFNMNPVEGASCAVSYNNPLSQHQQDVILLGVGYTDENGEASISLNIPRYNRFRDIPQIRNLDIVVMGYNKIPYFGKISIKNPLQADPGSYMHRIHI